MHSTQARIFLRQRYQRSQQKCAHFFQFPIIQQCFSCDMHTCRRHSNIIIFTSISANDSLRTSAAFLTHYHLSPDGIPPTYFNSLSAFQSLSSSWLDAAQCLHIYDVVANNSMQQITKSSILSGLIEGTTPTTGVGSGG